MFFVEAGIRLFEAGEVSEGLHRGRCECGLGQPTRRAGSGGWGRGNAGKAAKREEGGEGRREKGRLQGRAGQLARLFPEYILHGDQSPSLDPSGVRQPTFESSQHSIVIGTFPGSPSPRSRVSLN